MTKLPDHVLTVEQLERLAADMSAEAALAPKGAQRDALFAAARNLEDRARIKKWSELALEKLPSRLYH